MASPETAKAAPALTGNGPQEDPLPREIADSVSTLQARYKAACGRLHRRLDDIDTIDVWKRDLEQRIARAQLKFTYVDCLTEEYDDLTNEVADFRQICFALGGTGAA
jgi:hypothetical protein